MRLKWASWGSSTPSTGAPLRAGIDLLGIAGDPWAVASAAELREVHRVARYLEQLAAAYHRWYDTCRILPYHDEPVTSVNIARLWLAEATRIVLRNGLALLSVSAPERM